MQINGSCWPKAKLFASHRHCSLLFSLWCWIFAYCAIVFVSFVYRFGVTNLQIVQSKANKLQKYDAIPNPILILIPIAIAIDDDDVEEDNSCV